MNVEDFKRKLTVILSADVEGYSRLMGEDEESTVRTLKACRELMFSLIERYNGRVVDSPGDNLLAEFSSVRDAVRSAVEIQEELKIRNDDLPENRRMRFRIGINLGDVIEDGDRIYGDGINVAARVESLAEGGGISISGTVHGAIRNKLSMNYEFMGEHNVKNIKDPVRVYRVVMESVTPAAAVEGKKTGSGAWQRAALAVSVIIILGAAAGWYFFSHRASVDVYDEVEAKTIAVLPFENMSSDPEQKYFAEGLSEELLNMLAQIRGLNVTGRTSSFAFKDSKKTAQEIAEILGVDNVLEGSVRKEKTKLRITAQLLRASDGFHLWSKTYDRELKDIFEVQEDISKAVAEGLKATLGVGYLKKSGGTDNASAYELYLKAKGQYNDLELGRALGTIKAALLLDPEFALAYALKAEIYNNRVARVGDKQISEELDEGLKASQKAIELAPDLAETQYALGMTKTLKGDWVGAEQAYKKALELVTDKSSCCNVEFYLQYECLGYLERAKQIVEAQIKKDPLNKTRHSQYIDILVVSGDIQGAMEENKRAEELFKDEWRDDAVKYSIRFSHGETIPKDELPEEVLAEHNAFGIDLEAPEKSLVAYRRLYTDRGGDSWGISGLVSLSMYAAYFGDPEFAMELLEKAGTQRVGVITIIWIPVMKEVRQLPRFKEFVREIGLVDYWNEFGWPDLCRPVSDDDFVCD
jgi:adenylate cyclase